MCVCVCVCVCVFVFWFFMAYFFFRSRFHLDSFKRVTSSTLGPQIRPPLSLSLFLFLILITSDYLLEFILL